MTESGQDEQTRAQIGAYASLLENTVDALRRELELLGRQP